jgi:hypothetical protein
MTKEIFFRAGLILVALIMITSCKDQVLESDLSDGALLKSASLGNVENKIRLLEDKGLRDGFLQGYRYNEMGLVDSFYLSKPGLYNFWATMEYDNKKRMSKARFYYSEADFYDIVLTYKKDKLVKETWYSPGTEYIVDYYVNTYNKKGQLIRRDDPPYSYHSLFHYDNKGNLKGLEVINDVGSLIYGAEESYSKPVKNPFTAVPGMPVSLFFVDDNISSPNRFTGINNYYNDENGNKVVFFNWESAETVIKAGPEHYAVYQNSRDVVTDTWTDQTWTYEKSSGKSESHHNWDNHSGHKANSHDLNYYKLKHKSSKHDMNEMIFRH